MTEVKPGSIAVMASGSAHQDRAWSQADEIQRVFHGRVLAERKKPNVWAQIFPRLIDYRGEYGRFQRDEQSDKRTQESVRKLIAHWGWDR